MSSREEVYKAIDGEREYQKGWEDPTLTDSGGKHSTTEFLVYIRSYTNEALEICTRRPDPEGFEQNLHALRKIAALAVAALEQHGVRYRDKSNNLKAKHS